MSKYNNENSFNSKNDQIETFVDDNLKEYENHVKQNEKNDEEAVKEILDIFPGSKIDSQE